MSDLVSLRHLPGVDAIEAALILAYADREDDHALDRRLRQLVRTTFGIGPGDLGPDYPEWAYSVAPEDWTEAQTAEALALGLAWEAHFAVLDLTGDAAVEGWRELGWDVLDAQGAVLRCVEPFGAAMVACAKGLCGRSMADLAATAWAAKLEAERAAPDPKRVALNRSFLELGDRRGRRNG